MATETHDAVGHAADAAAHGGSSVGMPQLDFTVWGNLIFWLIVALVVVYLILSRVALPRLGGVLADRAGAIANDIAAAEELKQKAKQAEAAYEKALADARAEAGRIAAETKAQIKADLNEAIARADEEIALKAAEGEKALAEIRAGSVEAAETAARDTVAALIASLGFSAPQEKIDGAVSDRMKG